MRGTLLTLLTMMSVAQVFAASHAISTMMRFNTDRENAKIANKSLEFLKNIQEDLRRNNDDYAALEFFEHQQRLLFDPKGIRPQYQPQKRTFPKYNPTRRTPTKHEPLTRGMLKYDPPRHAFVNVQPPKLALDTRRALNVTQNRTIVSANDTNTTLFRSKLEHPKHFKKVRVDKLKQLINKGKFRLRELARTTSTTPQHLHHTDADNPDPFVAAMFENTPTRKHPNKAPDTSPELLDALYDVVDVQPVARPLHPAHTTPTTLSVTYPTYPHHLHPAVSSEVEINLAMREPQVPPQGRSPSPEQIDMAPARGAHIHIMRLKGRLCQRNVLNPEGPLYNSRGSTIMPAHKPELAHGRQFPQTRLPFIVLPRCCNCCKKSVLGCQ